MLKLITLLLTSTMTIMAGATIAPALPQISQIFKDVPNGEFWVKLMLTLPGLFTAIGAPFAGIIIDKFGRKNLLALAILLYGFAGGSGLFLNSLNGLLLGRALLGLSVGAIMTISIALIADYYQGQKRNQIMGIQAAFTGFGGVFFLTLGGFLADVSWRMPFLIYLLAFAVFPLVIIAIDEPKIIPIATNINGVNSALNPELTPQKIHQQTILIISFIYALSFLTMIAFYMIPAQLPFYLIEQFQVKNSQTGIAIACSTLASAIASTFYGKIKSKLTFLTILIFIYCLMGIGFISVGFAPTYNLVILALLIGGIGWGLLMPNMNVWLNNIAPVQMRGKMLGGLTTCLFLGQFLSPVFSQPIAQKIGLGYSYSVVGLVLLMLCIIFGLVQVINKFTSTN